MDAENGCDIIHEAEEVAKIGGRKSRLEELAGELNKVAPGGDLITQEQIEVAKENVGRVTKMRKNPQGKCRVIGVDKYDYSDWIESECDTPKEALKVAEEKTNRAKRFASDHSIATVYYAYDANGNYLGGDTWKPGEQGGLAHTREEEKLTQLLKGVSPLDLQCVPVLYPWEGVNPRGDVRWFQHPAIPNVFAVITPTGRQWYYKRVEGYPVLLTTERVTDEEVRYLQNRESE